MNRKTDPDGFDAIPMRHPDDCIKEQEWREVHEFIAGTREYRKSLCDKLDSIKSSIKSMQNVFWAVVLAILVPFVLGMVWVGEVKKQVEINTARWQLHEQVYGGTTHAKVQP